MTKVEAIVIRERVETVIDAVEDQTGHVGVTVVEAIGHGRQRGITHEYRGRIFESRFLPKAVLTFVVDDDIAEAVVAAIADAARSGNESGDGIAWTCRCGTSPTTERDNHWRRWRSDDDQGARDRDQHGVGAHRGDPRDVHAGGVRVPRGRPHAHEERRPHRGEERPDPRHRLRRLLPRRLRARVRRRRKRPRRRLGLLPVDRRAPDRRRGSLLVVQRDPGIGRLHVRGRLLRRLAGDRVGRDGRADEAVGVLRLRRDLHGRLLRRLPLDLEPGRLALLEGHAGLRGLDGRPLPGRPRRARGGDPARPAHRQVRRTTASRTRSPATTWPSPRSA